MIFIAVLLLVFTFVCVKWQIKIDLFVRIKDYNECVFRVSLFFIEIFRRDLFSSANRKEQSDKENSNELIGQLLKGGVLNIVDVKYFSYNLLIGIKDNAFCSTIVSASITDLFLIFSLILEKSKKTAIRKKVKIKYDENVFILASRGIIRLSVADLFFCIVNEFFGGGSERRKV